MATDKKLPRLIINKMNQEQFETVTPSEDELYLVEETKEYATTEQLETKQDVGDCVLKAGDTMTGNLTINSNSPTPLTLSGRITESSGTQTYQDIQALDNEGNRVGIVRFENDTNGSNLVGLNVMEPATGTNKGGFQIVCNTSGELYATAHAGAKRSILNWSFPSGRYKDLTLGASGTEYTAPANGYFFLSKLATGAQNTIIQNQTTMLGIEQRVHASGNGCMSFLPAKKDDVVKIYYSAAGTTQWFRFIYAEGDS